MPVKIKSFIPLTFLLCCADFRLLNRRHEQHGRNRFSICTVALPCLR